MCFDIMLDDYHYTQGIRKIIPNMIFEAGVLDDSILLTNVGFKEGGSKITMLKKYYYNQESIDKAKKALDVMRKKKDFGSVAFSTIGQEKKFTHHQHCIQSIAIRYYPDRQLEYTVFYRAAEMVKIFTGDMVFLRDHVIPIFGQGPVTYVFCNAALNAMYCPLLFIHDDQLIHKLERVMCADHSFFQRFYKWTQMYFSDEPINYSSAEVIREFIHDRLSEKKRKLILTQFKHCFKSLKV